MPTMCLCYQDSFLIAKISESRTREGGRGTRTLTTAATMCPLRWEDGWLLTTCLLHRATASPCLLSWPPLCLSVFGRHLSSHGTSSWRPGSLPLTDTAWALWMYQAWLCPYFDICGCHVSGTRVTGKVFWLPVCFPTYLSQSGRRQLALGWSCVSSFLLIKRSLHVFVYVVYVCCPAPTLPPSSPHGPTYLTSPGG